MIHTDIRPDLALACVPGAIPPAERQRHFALIRALFQTRSTKPVYVSNGLAFDLAASEMQNVATFVTNERKCCPFLRFDISLPPHANEMRLTVTGPEGTREFLNLELLGAR